MKFLSVVVLFGAALCHTQAMKMNASNSRAVAAECMTMTGATEMDVMEMFAHKPSANQQAKCLRSCFLHKLNIIDRMGMFNKDGAMQSLGFFANGDFVEMEKIKELVDNCAISKVSKDSCQAGDEAFSCILMWASKSFIDMDF